MGISQPIESVRRFSFRIAPALVILAALAAIDLPRACATGNASELNLSAIPAAASKSATPEAGADENSLGDPRIDGGSSSAADEELRSADRTLIDAIAANDRLAASRLLDSEFTWIDRDGRSRSKPDVVNHMVLLSAGADADLVTQRYGRVALIIGTHRLAPDNAAAFFARVWVRQFSGWRLLLYQETVPGDFSLSAKPVAKDARYTGPPFASNCMNPCRTLPYKPLSPEAQEIVASFMAGETAVADGDVETAARLLADDVLFVTPDRAQPMDKPQRVSKLRAMADAEHGGAPPAVASMALWVFGNAAVMSTGQESASGEDLRATRIWTRRGGRWQLAFSQQTVVQ